MTKKTNLPPGTEAKILGQYRNRVTGAEVTVTKGEPLPPTQKPRQNYDLVDKTKHRSK